MQIVVAIIDPSDSAQPGGQLDPPLPRALPLPVIEIPFPGTGVEEDVGFEGAVPYSYVPEEGEGGGVGEDDQQEKEFHWVRVSGEWEKRKERRRTGFGEEGEKGSGGVVQAGKDSPDGCEERRVELRGWDRCCKG